MDDTTKALGGAATRLNEEFFEAVFRVANKEFEVHAETRRRLRTRSAEQGLYIWLPSAARGQDNVWLVVRRRRLMTRAWALVATVEQAEEQARRVLAGWAGTSDG